jgi:cinnamoyl-CoA reductase
LAADRGLDLIVMNPATVAGPKSVMSMNNTTTTNCNVQKLLDQSGIFAFVHVDDLASAHVLTYQAQRAAGRYICFEKLLSKADIMEAASQMYPNYPMARYAQNKMLLYIFKIYLCISLALA